MVKYKLLPFAFVVLIGASPTLGVQANAGAGKYTELLAVIEELGKDIRPTYAGSKNASERLKKGLCDVSSILVFVFFSVNRQSQRTEEVTWTLNYTQ